MSAVNGGHKRAELPSALSSLLNKIKVKALRYFLRGESARVISGTGRLHMPLNVRRFFAFVKHFKILPLLFGCGVFGGVGL